MDNRKGVGGKAGARGGKGFYIALFLSAAVIGASAWIAIAGDRTNVEENENAQTVSLDVSDAVVTMLPAGTIIEQTQAPEPTALPESEESGEEAEPAEAQAVFSETVTSYVWPVRGDIEVPYAMQTLLYDSTMADWRTHDGIDVACEQGTQVLAAAGGTVVSVTDDDLYGTTVEIDHANGVHTVYANLAAQPAVGEGDVVTMGQTIGSVGSTALGETNEVSHLHFAVTKDGVSADPMDYLPEDWSD